MLNEYFVLHFAISCLQQYIVFEREKMGQFKKKRKKKMFTEWRRALNPELRILRLSKSYSYMLPWWTSDVSIPKQFCGYQLFSIFCFAIAIVSLWYLYLNSSSGMKAHKDNVFQMQNIRIHVGTITMHMTSKMWYVLSGREL